MPQRTIKLPFWVYIDTGGRFTYVFLFSDIMKVIRPKWIYMQQLKNKTAFGRKHAFPSFLFSFFSLVCLQFRFKSREAFNLLQSSSVSREQKIIMKKRNTKIRYQQTVSISRQLFPYTETPCIFWRVQDLRAPSSIWGPQMKIEITELRWREQKIIIVNQNKKDSPLAYCGILMKIFLFPT